MTDLFVLIGFALALVFASVLVVVTCIAATIAIAPAHPWQVTGSTPRTLQLDRRFSEVRLLFAAWQVATAAAERAEVADDQTWPPQLQRPVR